MLVLIAETARSEQSRDRKGAVAPGPGPTPKSAEDRSLTVAALFNNTRLP